MRRSQAATVKRRETFERDDLATARLIMLDPDVYGGPEALCVKWAQTIVARRPATGRSDEPSEVAPTK